MASSFSVRARMESFESVASRASSAVCEAGEPLRPPMSGRRAREVLLLCSRVMTGATNGVATSARLLLGRMMGVGLDSSSLVEP